MNAVAAATVVTPERLLAMSDGKSYELVDGKLVRRDVSVRSSWIGGEILFLLSSFVRGQGLGFVWPADNGYQCFPDDPNKVRRCDVSFIRRERLDPATSPEGFARVAPDLVVEVLSPNDKALVVEAKVDDYLRAGVPLVWVVNDQLRRVHVHRPGASVVTLSVGDELTGGDVLPGFRCPVADFFPPAPPPPSDPAGVR